MPPHRNTLTAETAHELHDLIAQGSYQAASAILIPMIASPMDQEQRRLLAGLLAPIPVMAATHLSHAIILYKAEREVVS